MKHVDDFKNDENIDKSGGKGGENYQKNYEDKEGERKLQNIAQCETQALFNNIKPNASKSFSHADERVERQKIVEEEI